MDGDVAMEPRLKVEQALQAEPCIGLISRSLTLPGFRAGWESEGERTVVSGEVTVWDKATRQPDPFKGSAKSSSCGDSIRGGGGGGICFL